METGSCLEHRKFSLTQGQGNTIRMLSRSDELAAEANEGGEDPPAEEVHLPAPPPLSGQGRGAAQAFRAQVRLQ